jgi:outer membrane receptor protein involved in Fe transport
VGTRRHEEANGAELQLARNFGRHGVITGWTYRESDFEALNVRAQTLTTVARDSLAGYVQDKITLTDRWAFSPGVRYAKYDSIKRVSATNVVTTRGDSSRTTFAAQTNYDFDLIGDVYISWAQIERPLSNYDYDSQTTETLRDERGNSWQIGVRKSFDADTFLSANYSLLDMSNAIGRYSVFDPSIPNSAAPSGFGNFVNRSVNATQEKKALNLSATRRFGPHWTVAASYTAISEEFKAQLLATNPNDVTNINALINRFRPRNTYQADVTFQQGRYSTAAMASYYTGSDTAYFSDRRFLVLGLVLNYQLFETTELYLNLDNLTDESWENKASAAYGPGAFPQPGRSFMAGVSLRF